MKKKITVAIVAIFLCIGFAAGAFASAKEIRDRMIARLPEIKALKDKGLVGENNKGFFGICRSAKRKTGNCHRRKQR